MLASVILFNNNFICRPPCQSYFILPEVFSHSLRCPTTCPKRTSYLLTELSPSWGAANCAAPQELPSILWKPKVQYRVHKSPPLVPILSHINPIHSIPSYLRSVLKLSTHLRLGLPSGLFPFGFPTNILYAFLFSPIRTTCPAHLVILDLIVLIILGEEYKLWNSSLCSFLQSPVSYKKRTYQSSLRIYILNY
jgi:hypothetical protein